MTATQWRTNVGLATILVLCVFEGACDDGGGGKGKAADPSLSEDAGDDSSDGGGSPGQDGGSGVDARVLDAAVGTPEYSLELLNPEMRTVIDALIARGGKPIETLLPEEARIQPTVFDAVMAVQMQAGTTPAPEVVGDVSYRSVPGAEGGPLVPLRVYTPAGPGPHPIVVYYHGGGWVIASVDTYDSSIRALTNVVPAVVVAVEYRKGPENKFPAAHDDAFAAYRWVVDNAAVLGGDSEHVAVAGESAGGHLAASVAVRARDEGILIPVHTLLIYPVASANLNAPSYLEHAQARPLNKAMIEWFTANYFRTPADAADPRISLVDADLSDLGPTTVINAEVDPLRSDGESLAKKLEAAGVPVVQRTYAGVTHEFFGMGAVLSDARDAVDFAGERLRESFDLR